MLERFVSLLPIWPVILPLAGAGLAALFWSRPAAQRVVTGATLVVMLIASALLLAGVLQNGTLAAGFGGWRAPFGIVFVADLLGAALSAVVGLVALAVAVYLLADLPARHERAGFHPLFLGMMAGVNGAFLTGDLFNLYVWFEVMLVSAMGLILLDRRPSQIDGALRYAAMNVLGTILVLVAIALVHGAAGTLTMADLARTVPQLPPSVSLGVAAALFLAGFGLKAGIFPFLFWLPASYPAVAPGPAAAMAGLLTKVGVYAALRVFTLILPMTELGPVLAVLAALTMAAGLLGAVAQWDMRRILAFNIVGGVGYMLMAMSAGTERGLAAVVFYLIHHIVVMAALFLCVGAIRRACGSFDLHRCGGLMRQRPLLAFGFAAAALSLAGMPPFSGFWAKLLVIDAALREGQLWLAAVALWVGLLTLYSMSRIWIEAFWKDLPGPRPVHRAVPAPMMLAVGGLAAMTLLIGLAVEPVLVLSSDAAASLADPTPMVRRVMGEAVP